MTYQRGDIVIADIPDEHGKPCDHHHPAMVLRGNLQVVYLVAISTKYDNRNRPLHWLLMDYHPGGHPITGLVEPCVLKCNWVVSLKPAHIVRKIGIVPNATYESATSWILNLIDQKKKAVQAGS